MARHEIPLLKRLALAALCTALPALGVAADASLHVYGAVQRELASTSPRYASYRRKTAASWRWSASLAPRSAPSASTGGCA